MATKSKQLIVMVYIGQRGVKQIIMCPPNMTFCDLFNKVKQAKKEFCNLILQELKLTGSHSEGDPPDTSEILSMDWECLLDSFCFGDLYVKPPTVEFYAIDESNRGVNDSLNHSLPAASAKATEQEPQLPSTELSERGDLRSHHRMPDD
jgi:hypothetical protein